MISESRLPVPLAVFAISFACSLVDRLTLLLAIAPSNPAFSLYVQCQSTNDIQDPCILFLKTALWLSEPWSSSP